MAFIMSSTKTMPGRSSSFALARKGRAAMMCLISALSIAACIASAPMVKLRLTGTLPASIRPILTSAAPTEAGSRMPTRSSPAKLLRKRRASSTAPVSALPKVTLWPSESAMQKRRQECLAWAMKRRWTRSLFLRRCWKASPPISSSLRRTSQARVPDGIGAPKVMVTG